VRSRKLVWLAGRLPRASVAALVVLIAAAPALATHIPGHVRKFPGDDPNESVRINTPNDPNFDHCERDDEDGSPTCSTAFDEQYERFGFAPNSSEGTALYHNSTDSHVQRLADQNTKAGRTPLGQVPGVSADRAWKYSTGDPDVQVAILDTGIRWKNKGLRKKIWLNRDELPLPSGCTQHDCNGDGAFNVDDYAGKVDPTAGHAEADDILDGSDLIARFSDGGDEDGNGYTDDIVGWDFFDNDNDPYDASSYSSADDHGEGRAEEAGEQGNDGRDGIGVCPDCQVVPMRIWDTFVIDTNNFAQAALYAADNEIEIVEGAVGGLFNSSFARATFEYAYRRGVFFAMVSSDLNTANHNIPTLYDEAMMVQGTVADVQGLGDSPPSQFVQFFNQRGVPLTTNAPIQTWFRNSGTTQYGGHAHVVMPAVTGSAATGQASGAVGLIASFAREKGAPLEPNEIKQLITMTAEDVVEENTGGLGTPDPAHPGWDQHFGYGKPDLGLALERIKEGKIPPEALITSPEWFVPFNVDRQQTLQISGRLSARRAPGYTWKLQWAPGIEPAESEFRDVVARPETTALDGILGTIDLTEVRAALDARPGGGATEDPTAPSKGPGDKDPNEPAFTVRVVVSDSAGNRGEDRKMLFAYRDPTERYSKDLGTGGEASERLFDLDGDNGLDTVLADSSGELRVLKTDGTPLESFNNGEPVRTRLYPNVHQAAPPYASVEPPREVLRTPAIGDIDGDLEPEIVDSAGEHVYAWNADGTEVAGFPVRLNPAFSEPVDRTRSNHVKRGFSASPTLGDLNGDGELDIVIPGLDQHVYGWCVRSSESCRPSPWAGGGNSLTGFPKLLKDPALAGAEIINTAALGDVLDDPLDPADDDKPEIVSPTAEFDPATGAPSTPGGSGDLGGFANVLTNFLADAPGGSGRVYALSREATVLPGWPTEPNGLVPDALPFVGPGVDHILVNVDADPQLEAIGNLATGELTATNGDSSTAVQYDSQPQGGEAQDKSKILHLFENPIAANIDGLPGPEVIKGGITLNGLVNVGVAVGQNLPFNHVVQAWNAQTGASLPSFPQAVEDFQLLSSPAVGDVSDAPGNEIVVGTGLYYLRNINVDGIEGTGWPKFTGGWIFSVPAIGDADGDGKLEIAALTREGHAFLWKTDRPACGTNDEWWTSRHDEWNTGAYGTDTRPPGTPRDLETKPQGSSVKLSWTVPGDDWLCGTPRRYRIIKSSSPIRHPTDGTVVGDFDSSKSAGDSQSHTVSALGGTPHVAVLYQDEAGNWGHLASTAVEADLSLTKTDSPDPLLAGQTLTYTLRARNSGPQTATAVRVTDYLPAGAAFKSASSTQGSCTGGFGLVSCELGELAKDAQATVTIEVTPQTSGTIENRATVDSAEHDPDPTNNAATASTTVDPAADLQVTKTDSPDPVHLGQQLTYAITVKNNGGSNASGVILNDQLPRATGFGSVSTSQGSCTRTKTSVTCNLRSLASGATATVTIVVKPTQKGTITNTASATATQPSDPNTANNTATATTTVLP
jgi:uncharacterized repeat protein (TIGR01451 family)